MSDFNNKDNKEPQKKRPTGRKPQRVRHDSRSRKDTVQEEQVTVKRSNSLITPPSDLELVLSSLYRNLYVVGVFVLRKLRTYRRRRKLFLSKVRGRTLGAVYRLGQFVGRLWRGTIRRLKAPFVHIGNTRETAKKQIARAREKAREAETKNPEQLDRQIGVINRKMWRDTGRHVWRVGSTVLNYAAPVVAGMVFLSLVSQQLDQTIGLEVIYKGTSLGTISSERDFTVAKRDVDSRLVETEETTFTSDAPLFRVVEIDDEEQITKPKEIADGIIQASSDDITLAYGLYADGVLVGAVEDRDKVINEISAIQEANKTGKLDEQVKFEKAIGYTEGLFPTSSIISSEELIKKIRAPEGIDETYIVETGDTIESIALANGVPFNVLNGLNPAIESDFAVGQTIYLSRQKQFLSVKNIYVDTYEEPISFSTIEREDPVYAIGFRTVESAGIPGAGLVTAEITMVDGVEIGRVIRTVEHLRDPVAEHVVIGVPYDPAKHGAIADTGFKWPGRGGYIGTVLGGYPGHTGIDINGTGGIGSPIYASASGTVIKSQHGWTGYGNHIIIDHGNGFTTLYAHATELFVSVGDQVGQGQQIATVGSTGNSSGPHIHFEVKYNGQTKNPTDYVNANG